MNTDAATNRLVKVLRSSYGLLDPQIQVPEDGLGGNTYIITAAKQKFVAKVFDNQQHANVFVHLEKLLKDSKLPTPRPIMTTENGLIAKMPEGFMVLSEYLEGDPIGWNNDSALISSAISVKLAKILAKVHSLSHATKFETENSLSVASILNKNDSMSSMLDIKQKLHNVRNSIVHGDLTRENILLSKNRASVKGIIDFGDAHYDYITYDIAVLLTQVYITKTWGIDYSGIKDFLTAYNNANPLNIPEKESIVPLMKLRNLGLLQEINQELEGNSNVAETEALKSIKSSLEAKLNLLSQDQSRLKEIVLGD